MNNKKKTKIVQSFGYQTVNALLEKYNKSSFKAQS